MAFAIACACPAWAEWSVAVGTGTAANLETTLSLERDGRPDESLRARYATRPWSGALYYAWRVERWSGAHAWDLQLLHHKLYLKDPVPPVQQFQVTHGYNMLTLGHAWRRSGFVARAGAGVVIAHPEVVIDGEANTDGGYHVTGPCAELALERRVTLAGRWHAGAQVKATAARARVPIPRGSASVPNVAVHGIVSTGFRF